MVKNRKAAQDFIISLIHAMLPDGKNKKIYEDLFAGMDDARFEEYINDLDSGKSSLAIFAPNWTEVSLNVERNLAIAKKLGHNFFERIWIHGDGESPTYLTPIPYMVVDLPINRQAQLLVKKISIPEDNRAIDEFTGQATGRSKGSSISYNETQVLAALDLTDSLEELIKYRGGDTKGFDAMNTSIAKTGGVSMKSIAHLASGVESTKMMKVILTCMHFKTEI